MTAISVIIPVYNAERRLKRLLQSLYAQSFRDYEVVCINDGSTDNTLSELQKYCSKFEDFRIISLPENQGSYNARIAGIRHARGEYIYMPDADDSMYPKALDSLFARAQETNADIVCMGARAHIGSFPRSMQFFSPPAIEMLTRAEMLKSIYYGTDVNMQMWNKLYRKRLFNGVSEHEGHLFLGDDTLLHLHACTNSSTMVFTPYTGYSYYLSGSSCNWQSKRWEENISLFRIMQEKLSEIGLTEHQQHDFATRYAELFCLSYVIGIAQRLFLSPFAIGRTRKLISEEHKNPIWDEVKILLQESDNQTARAVASGETDAIIAAAKERNRGNFKNELISYLASWKCPW